MSDRLMSNPSPYGLGLLGPDSRAPQEAGKKDWGFDKLGIVRASATSTHLLGLIVDILDQKVTQSCVAHAWEQALRMERKRLGYPVKLGSRLFGYANARAEHGEQKEDAGTYLRTYAWALKKVGSCPEEVWPFDLSKVNVSPSAKAYREAWALRGIRGYFKIYDTGFARTEAIRAALAAGKPVVFGAQIDADFMEMKGPSIVDIPKNGTIGGHAMCLCGYRLSDAGDYNYRIVNSWSKDWRDDGTVELTEEYVQWDQFNDIWVVSLQ